MLNAYLPVLRRNPALAAIASLGVFGMSVIIKLAIPDLPPFVTLFPTVLLCALLGGKWIGRIALVMAVGVGALFAHMQTFTPGKDWLVISVAGFAAGAALTVYIIELLDTAIARLQLERRKLDMVLNAAGAATWELHPNHKLHWDENFFRLVGLSPSEVAPSTEQFLSMVHPEDRLALAEARDLMNKGIDPKPIDEYRLIKPDGSVVWLENRRIRGKSGDYYFIGMTQDISRRKRDEENIRFLLRELAHRVKNQLAVVSKIASETRKQTTTSEDFDELFGARLQSLAKSHDLLVKGGETGADCRSLLLSQLEGFASAHRVEITGPAMNISPLATQYLAMAFHELATNAVKYGALSTKTGIVKVSWARGSDGQWVTITWQELGGPSPSGALDTGFGSIVLRRLAPSAMNGKATLDITDSGLQWTLTAPAATVCSNP
jgi:PAS domain S-box-containing protein